MRMSSDAPEPGEDRDNPKQRTPKGHEIPARKREDVLRDFRKIVAPLKDRRPKT